VRHHPCGKRQLLSIGGSSGVQLSDYDPQRQEEPSLLERKEERDQGRRNANVGPPLFRGSVTTLLTKKEAFSL